MMKVENISAKVQFLWEAIPISAMVASGNTIRLSAQAYLAWEAEQPIKYEYLNGEAYAMTGGTLPHNDIAVNLTTLLRNHLRGKGCKVRMADAKVGITVNGPFFYPDVLVTCDPHDLKAKTVVQHPCLIIEVLSPGTEGYDRGEKFRQYRRLPSLKEYVLVNADSMGLECYRLNAQGRWELTPYFPDLTTDPFLIEFLTVEFECNLDAIYEEIEFLSAESDFAG